MSQITNSDPRELQRLRGIQQNERKQVRNRYNAQDDRLGIKRGTSAANAEQLRNDTRNNQLDAARSQTLLNQTRTDRNADMAAGRQRGEEIFGNQALGRVDANKSAEIQDILSRRQANLDGFTPQEQEAMRDQNMRSIVQSQQAGSRDLARNQARSGVRGGLAAAQQQSFQAATQGQIADQERQLFLSQIGQKRDALDRFEGSQRTTEQDLLGRQQFNLDQGAREKLGALSTELGMGSLGAAERASIMQQVLGERGNRMSQTIAQQTKSRF